ncbi:MAG: Gfo/Idh/MocA family oxidoreductase [Planctomycetes bacterium]|nr:Gfo/Idh/MocA family oxidoreductase [Planctomycetota bacterium]
MVRVGLVGGGSIGHSHASSVRQIEGAQLVALADIAEPVRQKFAQEFGILTYPDYPSLLAQAEIDAVIIGLPDRLHCPVTVAALAAGKHVLVEKPMAASVAECRTMVLAAARANRKLMVGQAHHFLPTIRKAREIIQSGTLGQPVFLRDALIYQHWAPKRQAWFFNPALAGGGAVIATGVHQIDRMRWILGSRERTVSASWSHRSDVPDLEAIGGWFVRYENGCAGQFLSGSHTAYTGPHEYEILCTRGILRGTSWGKLEAIDEAGVAQELDLGERKSHILEEDRAFIQAIARDEPVPVDGQWGLEVLRVIEAVYESARSGKEVHV